MSVMQFDSVVLPPGVEDSVLDLAGRCDLLLFGELHGTREVPALVGGLLNKLHELGYREIAEVLAIRIPTVQTVLARAVKKTLEANHE